MRPLQIVITRISDDQWKILFMNETGTLHSDEVGKGAILSLVECHLESLEPTKEAKERLSLL